MKLNQLIAIVQGKKTRTQKLLTEIHRGWHNDRIGGINRTYEPTDVEGEIFPPESRRVQLRVPDAIQEMKDEYVNFLDCVATQDSANTSARADVKVDNKIVFKSIPVTTLLFMEKQLVDLRTFAYNIPTLPPDRVWTMDEAKNCWVTKEEQTVKTQKIPTTHVMFEPTEHQPGQAEIINIDKMVGHWTTIHMSGAMPESEKAAIIKRIEKLQEAVKVAREEANSVEISFVSVGTELFSHIFPSK